MMKSVNMNRDEEIARLTEENENIRKIVEVQRNTINRLIEHFILGGQGSEAWK